jgi:hypothetical protein
MKTGVGGERISRWYPRRVSTGTISDLDSDGLVNVDENDSHLPTDRHHCPREHDATPLPLRRQDQLLDGGAGKKDASRQIGQGDHPGQGTLIVYDLKCVLQNTLMRPSNKSWERRVISRSCECATRSTSWSRMVFPRGSRMSRIATRSGSPTGLPIVDSN